MTLHIQPVCGLLFTATLLVAPAHAGEPIGSIASVSDGFVVMTAETKKEEVGEASYNVENCKDVEDTDADDTDKKDDGVESIELDECKKMVK